MMDFFSFFFTGEGWGWRLMGLLFLIGVISNFVPSNITINHNIKEKEEEKKDE